jgi:chromosome segregation ATPase
MNQPTREEFEDLKRRLIRVERQTEPMHITRLEIDSGSIFRRLDEIQEDTNTLKVQMEGARADIQLIKTNHSEIKGYLENHSQRLESIEQKQDTHTEILGQLMNFGEETKNDIATMKTIQQEHSARFDRLEELMLQILNRLPKPEGE